MLLIMIVIMIIMNMQNKLCTMQFVTPPNDWFYSQSPSSSRGTQKSRISQNSRKRPNSWKNSNSWTREDSNSWKREEQTPVPLVKPPFINWAWCPRYGIFPAASLDQLPGCAPSCTPARYLNIGDLEKVLHFLATTENISVINIFVLLKPQHSSYSEGS